MEYRYTERGATEREDTAARLRAYFESPRMGIAITSPTKGWLEVNDHLCRMLGHAREALVQMTWLELTHPDDVAADVAQFDRLLRGEIEGYALDKRFLRKDGSILWALLSMSCVRRHDRSVDYCVSLLDDISQRKAAEAALVLSEARLVRLLEGTSDGFGDFDDASGRVTVTPRYCEIHGLPSGTSEVTTADVMATIEPVDLPPIHEDMEAILRGEKDSHVWEYRVRKPDGALRWVQSRGKVAGRDAAGRPIHVSGSITDVHDRRQAEEALRQSEARFRRLFQGHSAVKLIIDPATGQILDANAAAVAFYGWSLDELRRMRMSEINALPPENVLLALASARLGERSHFEFRHRRADGSVRDVEVFSNAIDLDGRPHIYSIIHDVTERRLAEEERERVEAQNRQLLKAESLGRMAAAIAHHFNNQLQAVLVSLELATDELGDEPRGRDDLIAATAAARKAADLSRLMRTYMGKDHTARGVVDLSEAAARGLAAAGARDGTRAQLETELASPGPRVLAGAMQLEQLVENLVTNALEALGEGPRELRVSVGTVDAASIPSDGRFPVDFRPEGNAYARLEVADSGSGIPARDIERIFDPFFTTKFLGRGLGLAVVLGIVRSHQGAIAVAPRPEGGTTFSVFLPILEGDGPQAPSSEQPADATLTPDRR